MVDVYDLVVTLIDTGARYSEIAKIKWSSIKLNDRTIRLWRPKVRNESVLYMTDRVYSILKRRNQTKSSPYVFTNRKGGPRNTATLPIRKAFKRANIQGCTVPYVSPYSCLKINPEWIVYIRGKRNTGSYRY